MLNLLFNRYILFFYLCIPVICFSEQIEWNANELSILKSLSLSSLPPLPNSPSNRVSNNSQAQKLGKQLFFEKRLSGNGELSCASCHQPEKYFTDGIPLAKGAKTTNRNTPTIVSSGWLRWFYWDGRRDSLWSQALIPFEAEEEMASSRLAVTRFIASNKDYRLQYESIFGGIPKILSDKNLPEHAGPIGDKFARTNWQRLSNHHQQQINQVYSNIGKTIAAYERTLTPKPTRFDHYIDQLFINNNQKITLTEKEIAGIKLFINPEKTQCMQCHNGPLLTNNGFHNIGTGKFKGESLDFGRMLGLQAVLMDEFNCLGIYSDAKPNQCTSIRFLNRSHHIPLQGAFKTPSLRNVQLTAPYFHDGRFDTLVKVIQFYNQPPRNNGSHELKKLELNDKQLDELVAFLNLLTEK